MKPKKRRSLLLVDPSWLNKLNFMLFGVIAFGFDAKKQVAPG